MAGRPEQLVKPPGEFLAEYQPGQDVIFRVSILVEVGAQAAGNAEGVGNPAPGSHIAGVADQPRQLAHYLPEVTVGVDNAAIVCADGFDGFAPQALLDA